MPFDALLNLTAALWGASELWLATRRRAQQGESRDAGTLRMLSIVLYSCVGLGFFLYYTNAPRLPEPPRAALRWAGLGLMLAGMALRFWAIRVLARQFTVDVAIREGHELIRSGPYALVRHPSYTGSLMTFLGAGLALGNWASLVLLTLPPFIAFYKRIRVEEAVLREAFPHRYEDYARSTKRLIPYLW